ncbi:CBO0543 family protein [Paenibacillus soyae]|uniref:Uncharacterized protein n=1 Tax=Paenibacillus soyae TaxID=2969249 RepID=A0A9X2MJ47_9BACL|nr:CBO0543 family protein [Paenibacillus soyae]MCR2802768.1 hypothetical protein [Paenibacillus soyae]
MGILFQSNPRTQEIYKMVHETYELKKAMWLEDVFLTWQWWLGVALTVLPWIFWLFVRKKEHTHRFLYAAFFVMVIAIWLDSFGVQLGLWHYNYEVSPFSPNYKPWDITLIPVMTMLTIQWFPKAKAWIKGAIYAALIAFVFEPLFVWIGFVHYPQWEFIFSYPVYFLMYVIASYLYRAKTFNARMPE